jgi:hypothetical protein
MGTASELGAREAPVGALADYRLCHGANSKPTFTSLQESEFGLPPCGEAEGC